MNGDCDSTVVVVVVVLLVVVVVVVVVAVVVQRGIVGACVTIAATPFATTMAALAGPNVASEWRLGSPLLRVRSVVGCARLQAAACGASFDS
jgi:hypothetical protein